MAQPTPEEERERTLKIRKLNDQLRTTGMGGRIVVTQGIQALPENTLDRVLPTISQFSDFTDDNDPYEEHDFGAVTIDGHKIFWKIDYYDESYQYASPDPTDPNLTCRVMTIMLAEEY